MSFSDHKECDFHNTALHVQAVIMMLSDDSLIEKAKRIVLNSYINAALKTRLLTILDAQDFETLLELSDAGDRLRQYSPVSFILSEDQRMNIIIACKKHDAEMRKLRGEL